MLRQPVPPKDNAMRHVTSYQVKCGIQHAAAILNVKYDLQFLLPLLLHFVMALAIFIIFYLLALQLIYG